MITYKAKLIILPTKTPPMAAWRALIGGMDAFTTENPRPLFAGIRRHLGIVVRSSYPQSRGSPAFRVVEISDVRWVVGPLRPPNALSTYHDSQDGE